MQIPPTDRGSYRQIHTVLTAEDEWLQLTPHAQLALLVLKLILPYIGIGDVDTHTLRKRSSLSATEADSALAELEHTGWIVREREYTWLINGLRYTPNISASNANHRQSVEAQLAALPRRPIVERFRAYYGPWLDGRDAVDPSALPERPDRTPHTPAGDGIGMGSGYHGGYHAGHVNGDGDVNEKNLLSGRRGADADASEAGDDLDIASESDIGAPEPEPAHAPPPKSPRAKRALREPRPTTATTHARTHQPAPRDPSTSDSSVSGLIGEKRRGGSVDLHAAFSAFWAARPRRGTAGDSRQEALKAWRRVIDRGDATTDELQRAIERHAADMKVAGRTGKDARFVPMTATWLNKGRWKDALDAAAEPEKPCPESAAVWNQVIW